MQSAALLAARRRGEGPFPVLRVTWAARGLSLGTGIYSPAMRQTAAGGVTAVTQPGGWERIKYGSGIKDKGLKAVETAVGVADTEGTLLNMLETYDPRGSAAVIDWATPTLALADWEPGFSGIVSDWDRKGLFTRLILKTDDTVLRKPIPPGIYTRAEWGSADEATIFGTSMPLVFGVHDSFQITGRGMLPATNMRYDKDLGFWWLASVDRMTDIERIYFDGLASSTAFTVVRGVYGQNYLTIISVASGLEPDKGVVLSFDGSAMDSDGLIAGTTLTGAPDQLRAIIEEYTYRSAPLSGWRGAHSICEATSWDAVSEYFALHKIESAYRTGGSQEAETCAEIIDSFLDAYPWVRMWWTESGQIAIVVIDPQDSDPSSTAVLNLQKYHEGGQVPFLAGDRREVYTHIRMPFMWSAAEQKYLSAYECHDVAALPDVAGYQQKVELVIDNPWSQCRFSDPAGLLNPAIPADPTIPCPPLPDPLPILIWDGAQTIANGVEYTLDSADDGSTNISGITWWEMREGSTLLGAGGDAMANTAWTPGVSDVGNHTVDVWWYYDSTPYTCYEVDSSSFNLEVT